ncbi:MAG: signal recognition particle-docking protein FtsY [Candidatus Cellulosilyticum pullistercoris]|uniref:Signal recognition particle receptor FtsY n=1 Tax=Candidatus Cellulosilyticum pullistercoris TaxID=2838521 RepID=A0A9E2KE65_9FIRM|nr:signal recognition particle-docking protein FtsY [Candidatus Cellulosilyticum pullistercoris]
MSLFKRLFGKNKNQEEKEQEALNPGQNSESLTSRSEEQANEVVLEEVESEDIETETDDFEELNIQEEDRLKSDEEIIPTIEAEEHVQVTENSEEVEQVLEVEKNLETELEEDVIDEKATEVTNEVPEKKGFIKRLFSGLSKTRDSILKGVDDVLSSFKHIDEELYEELEEALIMADFGVDTTLHIMEKLKGKVKEEKITDPSALKPALQEIITSLLTQQPTDDILNPNGPTVVLVIGVNGVGKTTSIGKMSHLFKTQHKKVLVAAADTFRAAAIEQLNVWTNRAGVEIIKHDEGSDAAAVVFDAISAAKSRKSDVLICDTAGRLQNKTNLMKELEKISRIIAREYPEAKKEILIVIDATTGQNAIQQVKLFKEVADISGIILTKLDGTAKGGAIVGIYESLKVPVKYIGVGEKIDDLQPFDAEAFAKALFAEEA